MHGSSRPQGDDEGMGVEMVAAYVPSVGPEQESGPGIVLKCAGHRDVGRCWGQSIHAPGRI
jgi:hypothetical protein